MGAGFWETVGAGALLVVVQMERVYIVTYMDVTIEKDVMCLLTPPGENCISAMQ